MRLLEQGDNKRVPRQLSCRIVETKTRHALWICLAVLLLTCTHTPSVAFAKAREWFRYENSHFVAYSNASEDTTRELLDDLERFRAAFLQVSSIVIPDSAPKTRVVIVGSMDFSKYTFADFVTGFTVNTETGAILALKAYGYNYKERTKTVIRHEYGHALLAYGDIRYPWWYEEGFAELVSSLEFSEDGRSFVFGGVIDRARYGTRPDVDWDGLVAGTIFIEHDVTPENVSSAYLQAWLLTHYTTLGDQLQNSVKLQRYFDAMRSGEESSSAFYSAFGMSASELWESRLQAYARRMPAYTLQFDPGAVDLGFQQAPAEDTDYRPLLDYLQLQHFARGPDKPPRNPLQYLPGEWAELSPQAECAKPKIFSVDYDAGTLTIDPFRHVADQAPTKTTFTYQLQKKRMILLSPVGANGPGEPAETWLVKLRGKNLLCLSRPDAGAPECETILKRCLP